MPSVWFAQNKYQIVKCLVCPSLIKNYKKLTFVTLGILVYWQFQHINSHFQILLRPNSIFSLGPPGIFSLLTLRQANEPLMVRVMVKQSEQYGPVVGLFMVSKPFVCVTGYEAVRDVMLNPDLMGRPNSFVFRLRTKNLRTGNWFF